MADCAITLSKRTQDDGYYIAITLAGIKDDGFPRIDPGSDCRQWTGLWI